MLPIDDLSCDVLILGADGAGMLAALHVPTTNPRGRIVIAEKGLIGVRSLSSNHIHLNRGKIGAKLDAVRVVHIE